MRIIAISDFDSGFKKSVISKIKKEKPDLIISHGDFCLGDEIRDIIFSNWNALKDQDKHWSDFVTKEKAASLLKKSLEQGERVIQSLDSIGVPVFVVYGNHDRADIKKGRSKDYYRRRFDRVVKKYENVSSIEFSSKEFNGVNFVGYGDFLSYMEYENLTLSERLKQRTFLKKYKKLFKRGIRNVLVTHNVPYNTKLDKIDNPKSPRDGEHVGSKYTRKLIQKFKPLLCISGHMHENQGRINLKKTICVNSGMGSEGHYAVIYLAGSKVNVALRK